MIIPHNLISKIFDKLFTAIRNKKINTYCLYITNNVVLLWLVNCIRTCIMYIYIFKMITINILIKFKVQ